MYWSSFQHFPAESIFEEANVTPIAEEEQPKNECMHKYLNVVQHEGKKHVVNFNLFFGINIYSK